MATGSGLNIGVNKMFAAWEGVEMVIIRTNGVKLRSAPSNAVGGPMAEYGSLVKLTGRMNKNKSFGWFYVEVKVSGSLYWVGGSEDGNADPVNSLRFYNP